MKELVVEARREFLEVARQWTGQYLAGQEGAEDPSAPIVLTGHQPELFHPGVWLKNFVAAQIAENIGGIAVNVLIDNDRFKNSSVWILGGSPESPSLQSLPLDTDGANVPYEMRRVADWDLVSSFQERALSCLAPWVDNPLLTTYWPMVLARLQSGPRLGHAVAQARNQLEARWGSRIFDVPLGVVADLPTHQLFLAFVLAELPQVAEVYNRSLDHYRVKHRLRNRAQPVPNLDRIGPWQEVPYWLWTNDDPTRRRLFVRLESGAICLSDLRGWEVALPYQRGEKLTRLAELLRDLRQQGVYLRPRALMTTLFLRMIIGDFFVHGIGGARYDEVTDEIIGGLFGLEPPPYAVVSGTLWLAKPLGADFASEIRRTKHLLRDVKFHPEKFFLDCSSHGVSVVLSDPEVKEEVGLLIRKKHQWIATPKTPENARQRHYAISDANQRLRSFLLDLECQLRDRFGRLQELERQDTILRFREFPFCFFPEQTLREFFAQATCQLGRRVV
ncbi:MAG: hypothetical protein NZ899_00340 [Thermoguttaceae bacterium]|nr:hypothetical protein [Thermoguttaceae bacterium]